MLEMSEIHIKMGDMRKMASDGVRLNISSPAYKDIIFPAYTGYVLKNTPHIDEFYTPLYKGA